MVERTKTNVDPEEELFDYSGDLIDVEPNFTILDPKMPIWHPKFVAGSNDLTTQQNFSGIWPCIFNPLVLFSETQTLSSRHLPTILDTNPIEFPSMDKEEITIFLNQEHVA